MSKMKIDTKKKKAIHIVLPSTSSMNAQVQDQPDSRCGISLTSASWWLSGCLCRGSENASFCRAALHQALPLPRSHPAAGRHWRHPSSLLATHQSLPLPLCSQVHFFD